VIEIVSALVKVLSVVGKVAVLAVPSLAAVDVC